MKLSSNFGANQALPSDHRGDEDNISPPLSWSGAPKKAESFVLIVDSHDAKCDGDDETCSDAIASHGAEAVGGGKKKGKKGKKGGPKTHWIIYDIPKEVKELREELSGAGSSDVGRLGMKEDAGQAPVVVDPMGAIDGYVDPEIKRMQDMIHGAVDASFDDRNRAKEGKTSFEAHITEALPRMECSPRSSFMHSATDWITCHVEHHAKRWLSAMKGKVLDKATLTAKVS